MLLASLLIFCSAALPTDAPKPSGELPDSISSPTEVALPAKSRNALPDAPAAKSEVPGDSDSVLPGKPADVLPKSQPFSLAPVKAAGRSSYESPNQRKLWFALIAAGHSAAIFDAYSTRRAISGGYGTEGDPLLRPFANSNAMYAATQVSPAIMDLLGHKMLTSNHEWMRKTWWVPQVAGASFSLSAGVHNTRLIH